MDSLDLRILRTFLKEGPLASLDLGFRRSFSSIAHELGVDETTVTNRLHRLYDSGFVKGWSVGINPRLVGQQMMQLWIEVDPPSSKPEAIARIRLMPGVAVVKDLYGPSLGVVLYYDSEATLQRATELVAEIAGSNALTSVPERFPESDLVLGEEDLRILRGLQDEPLTSYMRLARKIGRSARTIKRRIARLSREGAIYLVVEADPKNLIGGIVGSLLVTYEGPTEKRDSGQNVCSRVEGHLFFANRDSPSHDYFALVLTSVAQSRDVLREVLAIPGVATARLDLVAEVFSEYAVFAEQLERLRHSQHFRPSRPRLSTGS